MFNRKYYNIYFVLLLLRVEGRKETDARCHFKQAVGVVGEHVKDYGWHMKTWVFGDVSVALCFYLLAYFFFFISNPPPSNKLYQPISLFDAKGRTMCC